MARIADPMTSEENRHVTLSTEVSPRGAEVDQQLGSARANAGAARLVIGQQLGESLPH